MFDIYFTIVVVISGVATIGTIPLKLQVVKQKTDSYIMVIIFDLFLINFNTPQNQYYLFEE